MPVDAVRDLQNQTAWQRSQEAAQARRDSVDPNNTRNVGGAMGKHDFLMLLAAQLRHQDPLDPQSDSEFASQLAQFSSLEQMQNMNETLSTMANYQAYSLIGKYVVAETVIVENGQRVLTEIDGIVDVIFTREGRMYAQIGDHEPVLVSAITDVFDSSVLPTHETLQQTANNLIGRTVQARVSETEFIEGVVTGVSFDKGILFATIDTGADKPVRVPVGTIFDISQTAPPPVTPPPVTPPIDDDDDGDDGDGEDGSKVDGAGGDGEDGSDGSDGDGGDS